MKTFLLLAVIVAVTGSTAYPQTAITFTVNTEQGRKPISPYIYGIGNGSNNPGDLNITSRRLGGDRMCAYNWENNASNSGGTSDGVNLWLNDAYMTESFGITGAEANQPAAVLNSFYQSTKALGAYTLISLQAMGFVAKDKSGYVTQAQTAPSSRWAEVKFTKPAPISATPDPNDGFVYIDEELSFLVGKYGTAATGGVNAYGFDNEPGLWKYSFERAHPASPSYAELFQKHIDLATAIKKYDPTAEFFGGTMYGFGEFTNLQGAPDEGNYPYGWYLSGLLDKMKQASDAAGKRLMDVLELHWYPEARGADRNGTKVRIVYDGDHADHENDRGVAEARMQAPRSLWDPAYKEDSWIENDYYGGQQGIDLLGRVQDSIDRYNPGTKIAFGEYDYGGQDHVSGGIATADVLGIFGKYGVYLANYWSDPRGYAAAAMKLYRNYDGNKSTFGNTSVAAASGNTVKSSVYASIATGTNRLHIVVLNKDYDAGIAGTFTISSPIQYTKATIYGFDNNGSAIRTIATLNAIAGNTFTYTIPALSAYHIVLIPAGSGVGSESTGTKHSLRITSNSDDMVVSLPEPCATAAELTVTDVVGRTIVSQMLDRNTIEARVPAGGMPTGIYFITVNDGRRILSGKMMR